MPLEIINDDVEVLTVIQPTGTEVITVEIPGQRGLQGETGDTGPPGPGLPVGGGTGDVLAKNSATDGDTVWTPSTSSSTGNTLVKRDVNGAFNAGAISLTLAQQTGANAATRKDYVDALGTAAATVSTIARRDAAGRTLFTSVGVTDAPSATSDLTRKDYVDTANNVLRRPSRRFVNTSQTAALTDEGTVVAFDTVSGALTFTIPTNATVAFPVSGWIEIEKAGSSANTLTVTAAGGVTLRNPGPAVLYQLNSRVRLTQIATDIWLLTDVSGATSTDQVVASAVVRRTSGGSASLNNLDIVVTPSAVQHATRKDYVDTQVATRAALSHTHTAANISDSTVVGRAVLMAVDAAAGRTAIGAGTSDLAIGTTSTTAKAGDYTPPDATSGVKGLIQLAGHLTGTAAVPNVRTTSETQTGVVELATAAETTTGTDATRAVHPQGLKVELDKKAALVHTHVATTDLTATGTKDVTTFLRGDNTWAVPAGGGGGTVTSANITDATTIGRTVLTSVDAAAVRTAIGAGTSSLVIGTTGTTAKAGDYQPTAANISDSTVVGRSVVTAVDATAARTAIGAGTSSLAIGTTSTTAKAGDYVPPIDQVAGTASMRTLGTGATQAAAGNHTHTATGISDSTTVGRAVMTAVDAAAARAATGAGTSNLALGTTNTTAKAGDYQPTAANISDATAVGRTLLTAADVGAQRTALSVDSTMTYTATKTAAYTVAANEIAVMDVAAGATTLTLPTTPTAGMRVAFLAIGATTAVPLTVNRGGTATLGTTGATSVIEPLAGVSRTFQYDATNTRWLAISDIKPLTALDARFAALVHTHVATDISNSTAIGRTVLTAADAAAVRTAVSSPFGNGITEIQLITQAAYTALGGSTVATTLYVIQG